MDNISVFFEIDISSDCASNSHRFSAKGHFVVDEDLVEEYFLNQLNDNNKLYQLLSR